MKDNSPMKENAGIQQIIQWLSNTWSRIRGRYLAVYHKRPKWVFGATIVCGLGFLGGITFLSIALLTYLGTFGPLPTYGELQNIKNYNASELYTEDGVLLGKYYVENRTNADFDEISGPVAEALIATEDARFFEHRGIDFRALMRVLVKSILMSNDASGGGSTLSQQLAKNLYPRQDYQLFATLINKLREAFVARRLEKIYTKEELLKLYLNTVPFGEDIYGIKVASQRFFSKSPKELQVEEAAVLVGMLKANTYYNPVRHPDRAKERRNTVLNQMAKYGYLEPSRLDSLTQIPLEVDYFREGNNQGLATYFREHLRQELEEILEDYRKPDGSKYNLYTDGLKIFTTIDARLQQYAEEAVEEHLSKLQEDFYKDWRRGKPWGNKADLDRAMKRSERYQSLKAKGLSAEEIEEVFNQPVQMRIFSWVGEEEVKEMTPLDSIKYYLTILNAGFLAVSPDAGLVRAWVGGINHEYFQYDHVKSTRQVGSTFKPLVYAQALRSGMLPCEYTYNRLVEYVDLNNWEPRNADGEYGGVYSMEGALSHSVNTVTVEVALRAGIDSIRHLARAMGLTNSLPNVPSIALGTGEASLYDMVQVYSTFANRGKRPEMHYLDRIETSNGDTVAIFPRPKAQDFEQVLEVNHADMMIKMMASVVDSGTARRLRYEFGLYGDLAGKTGTTQNHSDGWFIGYNPKLVAGAWVGAESPSIHFRSMKLGQGSNTALPIYGRFMKKVYKDANFKDIRRAKFTPMVDSIAALMVCPPYLEDMPILVEGWGDDYYDVLEFNQQMQNMEREQLEMLISDKPRHDNESLSEYSQRIREHNERLDRRRERQEKRKDFWNRVLFGKEKQE